jgi:hypothetical protein
MGMMMMRSWLIRERRVVDRADLAIAMAMAMVRVGRRTLRVVRQ